MFRRITSLVTRRPKTVIALWAVIALALSSLGGSLAYKATTDDTAQFLPKGSESALATKYAQTAFGQEKGAHTVTARQARRRRAAHRDRPRTGRLAGRRHAALARR
jgi:putative drug exporter of the RND superfamily